MAFDGIITKAISYELQKVLLDGKINKIFEPNKNEILLGIYSGGKNYALNICIDSNLYRLHLTTNLKANPLTAPNFCMLLRKHLMGYKIKEFYSAPDLERIITIKLEGYNELNDLTTKYLIIELMGKHSNIILLNDKFFIIDSLRHLDITSHSYRDIMPAHEYIYPTNTKTNFYEITSSENLYNLITEANTSLSKFFTNKFTGFSNPFIKNILKKLNIDNQNFSKEDIDVLFNYLCNILNNLDTNSISIISYTNEKGKSDYVIDYVQKSEDLEINFFIDDFYYNKITSTAFKNYKDSMLKLILNILNKYNKRLEHMNIKLNECTNMEKYRIYGELITANLYRIDKTNISNIEVENYYDNNKKIIIPLDKKYSPSNNAKRFFKKYNKLKNTLEIVSIQKKETLKELDYIESIIYEIESCENLQDLSDIFEEISENDIFKEFLPKAKIKKSKSKVKKSTLTKNKTVAFNPIKYNIDNYTIFVGRNNKENDYLTLKFAKKNDIWFHTKDIHGSHVILKNENNQKIDEEILTKVASIAAYYSKARNSSNVPVDYCEVKYVKKPNGAKPGMVIYTNNHTLNVNPQI